MTVLRRERRRLGRQHDRGGDAVPEPSHAADRRIGAARDAAVAVVDAGAITVDAQRDALVAGDGVVVAERLAAVAAWPAQSMK